MIGCHRRNHNRVLTLGAVVCLAVACSADTDDMPRQRADLYATWMAPPDSSVELVEALDLEAVFDTACADINARLRLRKGLEVVHTSCDKANAYYDPAESRIRMCYELLDYVDGLAHSNPELSEAEVLDQVRSTWLFIFFHELGHALIEAYDVPVLGDEEDAVDQFSTWLLLDTGRDTDAILAASYWGMRGTSASDPPDYADSHSLDLQRFYNILCLVYGSDAEAHMDLVADGLLTETRAEQCPHEYQQATSSWLKVLDPWLN